MPFVLKSDYRPCGDQPQAIEALVRGLKDGAKDQVLLGITGSGKTFTVASVIEETQRPDACHCAQQDSGGPALSGIPDALS